MLFNTNYEHFFQDGNTPTIPNVTTTNTTLTEPSNTEIVVTGKDGYDSLYTVDLKFNTDITNMDANLLSDYINRLLGNHPYYIDVSKIVSIDINDNKNSISITVSNKQVEERLIELEDSYINLTNIVEDDIDIKI